MQWVGKHFSTIEAVFSVGSVQKSYLKNKLRYSPVLSSDFSGGDSHWKFVEDMKCDLTNLFLCNNSRV
jgi:hypothetical protein